MSDKKIKLFSAAVLAGLFIFLFISLTFSNTTVDPDTISCLLLYGRGDVTWENPVIWNVHIIYGLFLLAAGLFTSHLAAPAAFLSAFSTVCFLWAGFQIMANHLPAKKALKGMIILALIPGYHLLNLRLEDNLPLLAGISFMAWGLDSIAAKGFSLKRLLLISAGFSFAILFHTIAVIYIFAPLLMVFFNIEKINKIRGIVLSYALIIVFTGAGLAAIPDGYKHFYEAYTGGYGVESHLTSFSTELQEMGERFVNDWDLPFREVNNTPLDISVIQSRWIRILFLFSIIITNIMFYGFLIAGIRRAVKSWRKNLVILFFLFLSLAIPFILAAFTIERFDMPVLFGMIAACIAFGQSDFSLRKPMFQRFFYAFLLVILAFWTSVVWAQCARWVYRPESYNRYMSMLEVNTFENSSGAAMLFIEDESLFENIDYFLFIRRLPKITHYGIESDGRVYRIDGGWINDKHYSEPLFEEYTKIYVSENAAGRYNKFYGENEKFILIKEKDAI